MSFSLFEFFYGGSNKKLDTDSTIYPKHVRDMLLYAERHCESLGIKNTSRTFICVNEFDQIEAHLVYIDNNGKTKIIDSIGDESSEQ